MRHLESRPAPESLPRPESGYWSQLISLSLSLAPRGTHRGLQTFFLETLRARIQYATNENLKIMLLVGESVVDSIIEENSCEHYTDPRLSLFCNNIFFPKNLLRAGWRSRDILFPHRHTDQWLTLWILAPGGPHNVIWHWKLVIRNVGWIHFFPYVKDNESKKTWEYVPAWLRNVVWVPLPCGPYYEKRPTPLHGQKWFLFSL